MRRFHFLVWLWGGGIAALLDRFDLRLIAESVLDGFGPGVEANAPRVGACGISLDDSVLAM